MLAVCLLLDSKGHLDLNLSLEGGCGSFYAIHISSPQFKGLSTIKQHKLVNQCLKEEVKAIHGLQVSGLLISRLSCACVCLAPRLIDRSSVSAQDSARRIINPPTSSRHIMSSTFLWTHDITHVAAGGPPTRHNLTHCIICLLPIPLLKGLALDL
jgi:stress-induced morphogen